MIPDNHHPTKLRATLRAAAISQLDDLHIDEPLGPWPVHGLQATRRMRAIVAGIAEAAHEIDPAWFVDRDEDKRTITKSIMVMAGYCPTTVVPVQFSKRAVQVGRTTIPLTAPHAGELILTSVLDVIVAALPTA